MDKIVAWIKTNQLAVAAIAVLLAYVAYTQFSEPKSYEECMMQVVKEARTEATARYGYTACGKMFSKPEFDPNKPYEVFRDGVWEKVYPGKKVFIDPFVIHRQNGHEYNFLED